MKIRVPVEVAMVLARWRTFEMLMEDNTSEVVLALLVIASFLADDE